MPDAQRFGLNTRQARFFEVTSLLNWSKTRCYRQQRDRIKITIFSNSLAFLTSGHVLKIFMKIFMKISYLTDTWL